ncbi:unnamed protein product, partial [marine sediment metagenome]
MSNYTPHPAETTFRLFDATGRRRYDGTLAECQTA